MLRPYLNEMIASSGNQLGWYREGLNLLPLWARGFLIAKLGGGYMYYPTLEEVKKHRKDGNLIPVYREIVADLETPVSAFLKVNRGGYSFLLESVEGGQRLARYSFIGTEPYKVLATRGEDKTDPLPGIAEELNKYNIVPVSGLIIPDLPPEEGSELEAITRRQGLDLVYLLAPTSTEERIRLVAERSRGFIYLVSVTGVTGARDRLPGNLEAFVTKVRKVATQPLCVGFGISTPEQARQVARIADGVIVGSRIIQLMEAEDDFTSVSIFMQGLRNALDEAPE
jgi:hypothetical protein